MFNCIQCKQEKLSSRLGTTIKCGSICKECLNNKRRNTMAIKIKADRVVNGNGVKGYKVRGVIAQECKDLPGLYVESGPAVWFEDSKKTTPLGMEHAIVFILSPPTIGLVQRGYKVKNKEITRHLLVVGDFYSDEDFHERMEFVTKCGTRLMNINIGLKKMREEWNGAEKFVI